MSSKTVSGGHVWEVVPRVAREIKLLLGYSFILFPLIALAVSFGFPAVFHSPAASAKSYDGSWYYGFTGTWAFVSFGSSVLILFFLFYSVLKRKRPLVFNQWSQLSLILLILCLMVTNFGGNVVKSHIASVTESNFNSWLDENYGLKSIPNPNLDFELPVESDAMEFKNNKGQVVSAEVIVKNRVITLKDIAVVKKK